ncbi:MAG: hypothetical protein HOA61_09045, partial [Bacteroidetes bacterium]|nr:hypothetical protein [Bacteroidota bacterium]
MKKIKHITSILIVITFFAGISSCEKDVNPRTVDYAIKGLSSEYKISYTINGENFNKVIQGKDTVISFLSNKGEVLYFDIKYKDDVHKMSNFAALIRVNKTIFREAYAYDMKWADSATVNIPYPFEIIL